MLEDLPCDSFVLNGGDGAHGSGTSRTHQDVQGPRSLHQRCPSEAPLAARVIRVTEIVTERRARQFAGVRTAVADVFAVHGDQLRKVSGKPVLLHSDFKASNLHWTENGDLLVLDWEFAYAGPALMDVGQLIRWAPPSTFNYAFAESYSRHGGILPDDWQRWAQMFDLANLVGLLADTDPNSQRAKDVCRRIIETLRMFDLSVSE